MEDAGQAAEEEVIVKLNIIARPVTKPSSMNDTTVFKQRHLLAVCHQPSDLFVPYSYVPSERVEMG